jgi:protein-S-isoprenylcysteine O-methyltransferase Ste14
MIWWVLFVLFTTSLVAVSWRALRKPGSHGFYRFFAWECILGLLLLNAEVWFHNPLSWHQIISWILLVFSLVLVISGVRLLHKLGAQRSNRVDRDTYDFEKTTQLVTSGMYAYIRHPLYSSLLCLAWGAFFKHPAWIGFVLSLATSAFLYTTAKVEEAENVITFGSAYADYMKRSKMFIPYIL